MLVFGACSLLTGDRRSDRLSFCRQKAEAPYKFSYRTLASLGRRAFAFFRGWGDLRHLRDLWANGGLRDFFVSLCLRGCDGLKENLCDSSVSLCLCGFAGEPLASVAVDLVVAFFRSAEPLAPGGGGFKQARHGRRLESTLF